MSAGDENSALNFKCHCTELGDTEWGVNWPSHQHCHRTCSFKKKQEQKAKQINSQPFLQEQTRIKTIPEKLKC